MAVGMRPMKHSIRDLMWLAVIVSRAVGWWVDNRKSECRNKKRRNGASAGGRVSKDQCRIEFRAYFFVTSPNPAEEPGISGKRHHSHTNWPKLTPRRLAVTKLGSLFQAKSSQEHTRGWNHRTS